MDGGGCTRYQASSQGKIKALLGTIVTIIGIIYIPIIFIAYKFDFKRYEQKNGETQKFEMMKNMDRESIPAKVQKEISNGENEQLINELKLFSIKINNYDSDERKKEKVKLAKELRDCELIYDNNLSFEQNAHILSVYKKLELQGIKYNSKVSVFANESIVEDSVKFEAQVKIMNARISAVKEVLPICFQIRTLEELTANVCIREYMEQAELVIKSLFVIKKYKVNYMKPYHLSYFNGKCNELVGFDELKNNKWVKSYNEEFVERYVQWHDEPLSKIEYKPELLKR